MGKRSSRPLATTVCPCWREIVVGLTGKQTTACPCHPLEATHCARSSRRPVCRRSSDLPICKREYRRSDDLRFDMTTNVQTTSIEPAQSRASDRRPKAETAFAPASDAAANVFHAVLSGAQQSLGAGWVQSLGDVLPEPVAADETPHRAAGRRIQEMIAQDREATRSSSEPKTSQSKAASADAGPDLPRSTDRPDPPAQHVTASSVGRDNPSTAGPARSTDVADIDARVAHSDASPEPFAHGRPVRTQGSTSGPSASRPPIAQTSDLRADPPPPPPSQPSPNAPAAPAAPSPPNSAGARATASHASSEPVSSTTRATAGATVRAAADGASAANAQRDVQSAASRTRAADRPSSEPRPPAKAATQATFEELVRSIRTLSTARDARARIRLDPPELGHIRIDLRVAGGRVTLGMETETSEARELLQSRLDELRQALAQRGLTVDRIELRELATPPQTGTPWSTPDAAPQPRGPSAGGRESSRRRQQESDREPIAPGDPLPADAIRQILNETRAAWDARLDIRA